MQSCARWWSGGVMASLNNKRHCEASLCNIQGYIMTYFINCVFLSCSRKWLSSFQLFSEHSASHTCVSLCPRCSVWLSLLWRAGRSSHSGVLLHVAAVPLGLVVHCGCGYKLRCNARKLWSNTFVCLLLFFWSFTISFPLKCFVKMRQLPCSSAESISSYSDNGKRWSRWHGLKHIWVNRTFQNKR